MRIKIASPTFAWQPLTPRGVAAFADARLRRLLLVQFVVAALVAGAVVWFVRDVWFPQVREAIRQLPAQGEIRRGKLAWRGDSPVQLAGDRFLAIVVDLNHEAEVGHEADVCVEFGQTDFQVVSLLGYWPVAYPKGWVIALNRAELEPWWGAWQPAILAGAALACVAALMLAWAILAAVYCAPALLVAFFANRNLNWRGAWKLASAAQMPGALLMIAATFFYGVGFLDIVRLGACFGLHPVLAWVYVVVGPLFRPRLQAAELARGNPFAAPGEAQIRNPQSAIRNKSEIQNPKSGANFKTL